MSFKYNTVTPSFFQFIAYLPTRIYFSLFGGIKIEGRENLKLLKSKNAIFASNHTHEWDPVLLAEALIGTKFSPLFFVSNPKGAYGEVSWRKPFYGGFFFKLMGAYPLKRTSRNYEESLDHHIKLLNSGKNLCIFPEGYRNTSGKLGEARGGIAYLVYATKIPIVPVSITGIKGNKVGNSGLVIRFGRPIYYKDIFGDIVNPTISDYKVRAQDVMNKIAELI